MVDEWKIEDLPIGEASVITEPNPITGEIKQIVGVAGKQQERIIQTMANQTRNALIDLGWTPPLGTEVQAPLLPAALIAESEKLSRIIKLKDLKLCELTRADLMVLAVEYCKEYMNEEESAKRAGDHETDHAGGESRNGTPVPE